jgi:hypothetical protein
LFYANKIIFTRWIKIITNRQIIHISNLWIGIDGWRDVVVVDLHSPTDSSKYIVTRIGQEPEAPAQNRKNWTIQFGKLDGPVLSILTTVSGTVGTR